MGAEQGLSEVAAIARAPDPHRIRMSRAGDESAANACCGDSAARNHATCVVDAARPSTRIAAGVVSDVTALAMLDCPTNDNTSRRSAPSGTAASRGKRRYATQPVTSTAAVATTWAATIAAIVAVRPCEAATAIAVKRSAIEKSRKNERMS